MSDGRKPATVSAEVAYERAQGKGAAAHAAKADTAPLEISIPMLLAADSVGSTPRIQARRFQQQDMPSNVDDPTASNPAVPQTEIYLPVATREAVVLGSSPLKGPSRSIQLTSSPALCRSPAGANAFDDELPNLQ
jgi:hypothetical protein